MVVSDWSKTYIGMEHHSAKHCLFKLVGNVFGSDAVTSLGLWAGLGFIILFVIRKMTHFVHLSNESNLPGLNRLLILQEHFAISNGYCVYIVFYFPFLEGTERIQEVRPPYLTPALLTWNQGEKRDRNIIRLEMDREGKGGKKCYLFANKLINWRHFQENNYFLIFAWRGGRGRYVFHMKPSIIFMAGYGPICKWV